MQALHHVQITIPPGAEAAARDFYAGVLGLREIPKPPALAQRGGLWFELGQSQLHIGAENAPERRGGKAHVAYQVQDLAAIQQQLEAAGCEILASIPIPGMQRFESRDPFGNRLEFVCLQE
ncbi:MAG: VOC family protein [Candidatus Sericytochromatia bacterium]|nr:VOC family protein [Candidatus Sericytochromatia bacterium]